MRAPRAVEGAGSRYVVSVAGETHDVVVGVDGKIVIDGAAHEASLSGSGPARMRTLILDGKPRALYPETRSGGFWEFDLDGDRVSAEVLDARAARVRALSAGAGSERGAAALKAPMPGLVVQVAVETGEIVEPGAAVVIVEAMKMENELRAAAAARVERILVAPGEAVEKGQILVEFAEVERK